MRLLLLVASIDIDAAIDTLATVIDPTLLLFVILCRLVFLATSLLAFEPLNSN